MNPTMLEALLDRRDMPEPPRSTATLRKDIYALKLGGGPSTPEGKAASSRNSLRHGLTARTAVIRCEDQAEFDTLLENLIEDRKPEGELERQLTGEIAASIWRLARARQHEAGILERHVGIYDDRAGVQLQLVMRYVTAIERQLNRAIVRLETLQAQRRKPAEFVSQSVPAKPNLEDVATPEPAPAAENAPPAEPLVMVAGSSRPRFVSQIDETTEVQPASDPTGLVPHPTVGSSPGSGSQRFAPRSKRQR